MAKQGTSSQALKSIAGSALAGPGLLILVGNLDGAAAQLKALLGMPGEGLGLLSSVILAAAFDQQRLLHGLLQMLISFWPLLFVIGGAVLLRDASTRSVPIVVGREQNFQKNNARFVDRPVPRSTCK
jgi:hypothetical protein